MPVSGARGAVSWKVLRARKGFSLDMCSAKGFSDLQVEGSGVSSKVPVLEKMGYEVERPESGIGWVGSPEAHVGKGQRGPRVKTRAV